MNTHPSKYVDPVTTQTVAVKNSADMVIGLGDVSEYITQRFTMDAILAGKSVFIEQSEWAVPSIPAFNTWLYDAFSDHRIVSTSERNTTIWFNDSLIDVYVSTQMANVTIRGNKEDIKVFNNIIESSCFHKAISTVEWVHNAKGSSVSVPLQTRDIIHTAYPWLDKTVDEYIDAYMNSSASVLILIGPPGTGKTSLIRHMIARVKGSATVAYDAGVMSTDSLFASWLESENEFMVLEDSDAFLSSRSDGNQMMHKFLNVSEGLVSSRGKKLVFSTNLPNVNDIDEALMRAGRCFDVLSFRELTVPEAQAVADEIGVTLDTDKLHEGATIPLSKVCSGEVAPTPKRKKRTFGFAG